MEGKTIEMIEQMNRMGAGTLIIYVGVVLGLIVGAIKVISIANKKYKEITLKNYKKNTTIDEIREAQKKMMEGLNAIDDQIKSSSDAITQLTEKIIKIEKKSIDGDIELKEIIVKINKKLCDVNRTVHDLTESDMERNRAEIVHAYNRFIKNREPLDIYTYATIKDKYRRYTKEHGNHYVAELMEEIDHVKKEMLNAEMPNNNLEALRVARHLLEDDEPWESTNDIFKQEEDDFSC